jgi:hypothetical protein
VAALRALAEGGVDFVLLGRVAGGVYGSSYGTFDLDIVCNREGENLERLPAVLNSFDATPCAGPSDGRFRLDPDLLQDGDHLTLSTRLACWTSSAGAWGRRPTGAETGGQVINVDGHAVWVASLDHLIAMKEAGGRPGD